MSDREELAALRRLAELEARSTNNPAAQPLDPAVGGQMAAEGVGPWEASKIAAGRGFDKLLSGVEQIGQYARTTPMPGAVQPPPEIVQAGQQGLQRIEQEQSERDLAYKPLQAQHPIATALGEAAPYTAIPASAGVLPAAGMVGLTEAMKEGSPTERLARGVLGAGSAAVGGAAGKALGKAVAPVASDVMNATKRQALKAGLKMGVKPRLSEVTGSQFLARMEDMAARTPGGAGIMDDFATANTRSINKTAARTIGEQADELSPSVFASASDRLGKVFEDLKSLPGRPIQINQNVGSVADDILRKQAKMIPSGGHGGGIPGQQDHTLMQIASQAKTLAANKGKIDGETYQFIRSGLSKASYEAEGANKVMYGRLLEALDDAAEQSMRASGQGDLAAALRTARPQYGNLMALERGMVSEGGNVSPARLAQVLRSQNPKAFREGRGSSELYDIARYGESFKPLRAGSPTYEREASSDLLSLALKSPLAYGAAKATTSPMMTAYPKMLATNPQALMASQYAAALMKPAARGLTMGAVSPLLPQVAE